MNGVDEKSEKREKNDWTRQAIAVRKRSTSETRDLAFLVIGREFKNLAFYFALLAVPVFLLDALFFALFLFGAPSEIAENGESGALFWQNCVVYAVVALETAFVGSLATRYLGVWLFESERKIERREIVASWAERLPQLFYFLVLTRPFRRGTFYAETILLERTPFRKTSGRYSTGERVRSFRRGALEPNFWPATAAFSGYFLLDKIGPTLIATGDVWAAAFHWAIFPAFLFGLRFYVVVLDFLRYINYRVATEGWDLDLAFKVERAKLAVDEERWRNGVAKSALALTLGEENESGGI